jgi:hypothetical protein
MASNKLPGFRVRVRACLEAISAGKHRVTTLDVQREHERRYGTKIGTDTIDKAVAELIFDGYVKRDFGLADGVKRLPTDPAMAEQQVGTMCARYLYVGPKTAANGQYKLREIR